MFPEKHLESMETGVPLVYDNDDDIAYIQSAQSLNMTDHVPSNCSCKSQESSTTEGETTTSFKNSSLTPKTSSSIKTKCGDGISEKKESSEIPFHPSNKMSPSHLPEVPECILPKANGFQKDLSGKNSLNSTPSKVVKDPKVQLKEFDDAIKEVREILTMVSNLVSMNHKVQSNNNKLHCCFGHQGISTMCSNIMTCLFYLLLIEHILFNE